MTKRQTGNDFVISAATYKGGTSEKDWQASVVEASQWYGWEVAIRIDEPLFAQIMSTLRKKGNEANPHRGAISHAMSLLKSWPDYVLVHRQHGRTIMVEFKTNDGDYQDGQVEKLLLLHEGGNDVRVWRPQDWDAEVVPTLTGKWWSMNPDDRWSCIEELSRVERAYDPVNEQFWLERGVPRPLDQAAYQRLRKSILKGERPL